MEYSILILYFYNLRTNQVKKEHLSILNEFYYRKMII